MHSWAACWATPWSSSCWRSDSIAKQGGAHQAHLHPHRPPNPHHTPHHLYPNPMPWHWMRHPLPHPPRRPHTKRPTRHHQQAVPSPEAQQPSSRARRARANDDAVKILSRDRISFFNFPYKRPVPSPTNLLFYLLSTTQSHFQPSAFSICTIQPLYKTANPRTNGVHHANLPYAL
jgi:hypothetical protein